MEHQFNPFNINPTSQFGYLFILYALPNISLFTEICRKPSRILYRVAPTSNPQYFKLQHGSKVCSKTESKVL
ncbi:hypothetical protein C5167_043943 [Papaver somniferum]|uniref:Uncharacterized protein n=1 Tax=Papaver somniferum TaxID=3469 RepID=A0A4Y7L761_PAPSO|nr:hypothetical protein C5167_043943 [Papaver somniferum]